MNHEVTGCLDCCLYDSDWSVCNHPSIEKNNKVEMEGSGEDLSYIEVPVTPLWCPLNKEPITIIKK